MRMLWGAFQAEAPGVELTRVQQEGPREWGQAEVGNEVRLEATRCHWPSHHLRQSLFPDLREELAAPFPVCTTGAHGSRGSPHTG